MRRAALLASLALALALPALALAFARSAGDGTLSVRRARGVISFPIVRGVIFGRFDRGKIFVQDLRANQGVDPVLTGCDHKRDVSDRTGDPDDVSVLCTGTDVRFRLVGGLYKLKITGTGISLSAIGRGSVTLSGKDGSYALNDEPYQDLPTIPETRPLAAAGG